MELAVGYVFLPTDEELVDFLRDKIQGRMDSQTTSSIFEYDLYGDQEPWDIWNRFRDHNQRRRQGGDQDLYFFTQLKKVSINGSRINRKVGSGTWSGAYSETMFASASRISQYNNNNYYNIPIAVKKHFRYENDECPEHHGAWILHEFSLYDQIGTTTSCSNSDQFVVCRLRKKSDDQADAAGNKKKNKKRNSIKFDHHHHHQTNLQEPTAALLHSNKKMRLSDQNSPDHRDIHQVVDHQQHNNGAMHDYYHFESSSSAFGIGSSIADQTTPIILNDLGNNNSNNIIQQKEAPVLTINDNDDLQDVLLNNWDIEELLEVQELLFSEETNRKESSPTTTTTTAVHDDADGDEVIAEIEKLFFADQEAINHINGTNQDLDEVTMMMMNNSTDDFKYNAEFKEVITTGTTSLTTPSNIGADQDHDDHVLEVEKDENIQANELLDMNLSDLDTSFEEYFNANHPSFSFGF
ncbi:protein SOMBRERO [Ziziphus jujuba]|uniref:Protein SOMBRERO n=1 Tax=Ziziphus jujuba TaxID=326968 RepID=A0A6P6FJP2_ZIZJJ|nr:protein SOMBRERO [Ziziphus jujuba]